MTTSGAAMCLATPKREPEYMAFSHNDVAIALDAIDVVTLAAGTRTAYRQGIRILLACHRVPGSHRHRAVQLLERLDETAFVSGSINDNDIYGFLKQKEPAA